MEERPLWWKIPVITGVATVLMQFGKLFLDWRHSVQKRKEDGLRHYEEATRSSRLAQTATSEDDREEYLRMARIEIHQAIVECGLPAHPMTWLDAGKLAEELSETGAAERAFRRASRFPIVRAQAFLCLARLKARAAKNQEAARLARKALKEGPNCDGARNLLEELEMLGHARTVGRR